MFKKTLIITVLLISSFSAFSQIKFGLKAGMNSIDQPLQSTTIFDGTSEEFKIALEEANYGYHFGIMLHIPVGKIFLQPEVLFNSNSIDFKVSEFADNSSDLIKTEKFQYLDVPLIVGFNIWKLRLNAGPVGHIFINNKSELKDFSSYDEKFEAMTWGYQAGIGIELGEKMTLDLRYEGNFSNYGSSLNFFGNDYEYDNNPTRLIGTLGYYF